MSLGAKNSIFMNDKTFTSHLKIVALSSLSSFTGIGAAAVSAKFAAKTAKISIVSSAIGLSFYQYD